MYVDFNDMHRSSSVVYVHIHRPRKTIMRKLERQSSACFEAIRNPLIMTHDHAKKFRSNVVCNCVAAPLLRLKNQHAYMSQLEDALSRWPDGGLVWWRGWRIDTVGRRVIFGRWGTGNFNSFSRWGTGTCIFGNTIFFVLGKNLVVRHKASQRLEHVLAPPLIP
jgi:hypothetical protein